MDTTVLIDLSRGSASAADFVDGARQAGTPLYVSVISAMELMAGCRTQDEVARARRLVGRFALLHLSPAESIKAYQFMLDFSRSHGLAIPDALIAAVAVVNDLELATDNTRHFQVVPGLVAERPY